MQPSLLFIAFLISFSFSPSALCREVNPSTSSDGKLQTYIISVHRPSSVINSGDLENWYRSFLPEDTADSGGSDRLVYSYVEVFSGFAARLTEEELKAVAKKQGFVRAIPNKIYPLLTTHTPDFLGLPTGLWNASNLGKGVIVGVLDTGILPSHPSFHDDGVPPPPARWKGDCEFDKQYCNNKIIGARGFNSDGSSATTKSDPTDTEGHGSHTAATIAGNFVKDVHAFGFVTGTASGMAPHAHLSIYQVCHAGGCSSTDILAGLDAAVADGVDVLSLSLGAESISYAEDPVAIGAFAAVEKNITVVCAGGNNGPGSSSLSNEAPWILTVAASTVDRRFSSTVKLGNGTAYVGETLYQPSNFSSKPFPIIYPGDCSGLSDEVEGKIVICDATESPTVQSNLVKSAGGAGIISIFQEKFGHSIMAQDLALPGSIISSADGEKIKQYVNSAESPTASITFDGTVLGVSPAPAIAAFSSRGPNQQSPGILKPDVTAPGLNILAAWNVDTPRSKIPFNIISGTSMATPHVSGIAALIKSLHPNWSPAAIKSAIITSSDLLDRDNNRIKNEQYNTSTFFDSGAGHINPVKAANPGLVYELTVDDYIGYLCQAVGDSGVAQITRRSDINCNDVKQINDFQLNYPTITVAASPKGVTVNRTVTNVGPPRATYTLQLDVPKGLKVTVEPTTLKFSEAKTKQTFSITVIGSGAAEGNLIWASSDKKTVVRSALVVTASA